MSDFDIILYRKIKNGKQYNNLIPKTDGKSTFLGDGMTDFSVKEMANWVNQYAYQMQNIAPLLQKRSLLDTCKAVHQWCYWHFQYRADDETQYLRSPSYAWWYDREKGIDCKSYSIIASCILTNLGINHYIRRIKQPGFMPHLWTHVYIVVPTDQANGSLSTYYCIDGTVNTMNESIFTEKSDHFMSMKHYGLNGAVPHPGMNGVFDDVINSVPGGSVANNLLKGLSLDKIGNLFSGGWRPSCLRGSLNTGDFEAALANTVPAFEVMINDINFAIGSGANLMAKINKLFRVAAQMKSHSALKASGNWKSACSRDAVNMYKEMGEYYYNIVYTGFKQWLEYYFTVTYATVMIPNNTFDIQMQFDKGSDIENIQVPIVTGITPKTNTTNVKQFVINEYVGNRDNISNFNVSQFISGITKVVASFQPINNGTGNTPGNTSGGGNQTVNIPQASTKAGIGGVMGIVLFAAGVSYIFANMPDQPKNGKPAEPAKPTPKKQLSKK
ncbi:hypothetical protein V1389_02025 [Flavobacterium rakeshii]|uniref:hypothetical protein n=1 Tax=Flavobacterium rakeshii TaxID=1038845 RepID=UPI002E7AD47B|nr:hypothetical protein [Flavobacterium rakeshii]MEE1897094.1 hypothetical protein [Flavobacterium rakeshii]